MVVRRYPPAYHTTHPPLLLSEPTNPLNNHLLLLVQRYTKRYNLGALQALQDGEQQDDGLPFLWEVKFNA